MIAILCPVKDCGELLDRQPRLWRCSRGHSFDVARSGYCNLLQPNERRSKSPGDSAETVRARRRLLDRGIGQRFIDDLVRLSVESGATGPVLDAGCGEGTHLSRICEARRADGVGVDISSPAVDLAARRHPSLTWIVANADRRLPLADGSIGTLLSITARVNRAEFVRVLRPGGTLFVAVPGPDDLAELREAVLGESTSLKQMPDSELTSDGSLGLVRQVRSVESIEADAETIADLLLSTYRGQRRSQSEAAARLGCLTVTHSRAISIYTRGN